LRLLEGAKGEIARDLPWIKHSDPWAIYVSEVMLQQTQVSRVVEPWANFMKQFPTPSALAHAPLSEVLVAWQGLGFARRARFLHEAAAVMVRDFGARVPQSLAELRSLPGIGEYSAASIASFAYGEPVIVLDTNVARILSRAIAGRTLSLSDLREVAGYFGELGESAVVNQSLLDFGAKFCRARPDCESCPARTSCAWKKVGGEDPAPNSAKVSKPQSPFQGSRRQLRGQILKALHHGPLLERAVLKNVTDPRTSEVLVELITEGMVQKHGRSVRLAGDKR
jgi:A/G-specific adenine glycosylase